MLYPNSKWHAQDRWWLRVAHWKSGPQSRNQQGANQSRRAPSQPNGRAPNHPSRTRTICSECTRWRYHDVITHPYCLCGNTWKDSDLAEAKKCISSQLDALQEEAAALSTPSPADKGKQLLSELIALQKQSGVEITGLEDIDITETEPVKIEPSEQERTKQATKDYKQVTQELSQSRLQELRLEREVRQQEAALSRKRAKLQECKQAIHDLSEKQEKAIQALSDLSLPAEAVKTEAGLSGDTGTESFQGRVKRARVQPADESDAAIFSAFSEQLTQAAATAMAAQDQADDTPPDCEEVLKSQHAALTETLKPAWTEVWRVTRQRRTKYREQPYTVNSVAKATAEAISSATVEAAQQHAEARQAQVSPVDMQEAEGSQPLG